MNMSATDSVYNHAASVNYVANVIIDETQQLITILWNFSLFFFFFVGAVVLTAIIKRVWADTNELQTTFYTSAARQSLLINDGSIVTHRKRAPSKWSCADSVAFDFSEQLSKLRDEFPPSCYL